MESRGPLECTIGKYQIFHRMTDGLNRNKPSGYYQLVGPGADSSWIYDLDLAVKTAQELEAKHR